MRTIYSSSYRQKGLAPREECKSCGGPKVIYPVGWTLGDEPVYECKDQWHKRTVRQSEV